MKEMVENDLRIRQKPNSEVLLSDYLSSVTSVSDTLYAIIYSPMDCPRCEAAIPNFYRMLKRTKLENKEMLLITAYKDSAMAAHYNHRRHPHLKCL